MPELEEKNRKWEPPYILRSIPPPTTYIGRSPSTLYSGVARMKLSIGQSPFGQPPEFELIRSALQESGAFDRASRKYGIVDPTPAIKLVRQRFRIGDDPYVVFSNGGSDEILERIVTQLLPLHKPRYGVARIIGIGPQFSDIAVFVDRHVPHIKGTQARDKQMIYGAYTIDFRRRVTLNQIIQQMMEHHRHDRRRNVAVYLCNPNTPTGDVVSLDTVNEFVEFCARKRHLLILDEAFGDALGDDQSAIPLTQEFPNLIVLRSLSKMIGLSGERLGYAVMSEAIGKHYENVQREFDMPSSLQLMLNEILQPQILAKHLIGVREKTRLIKTYLLQELDRKGIEYLPTDTRVPILMIDGKREDFYERLGETGVEAAPGFGFYHTHHDLSNRYVRLTIPRNLRYVDVLIERVWVAINAGNPSQA